MPIIPSAWEAKIGGPWSEADMKAETQDPI
jgi:hypothetical protein